MGLEAEEEAWLLDPDTRLALAREDAWLLRLGADLRTGVIYNKEHVVHGACFV